ncbi:class I SAM-dependent methyltransferase [Pseudorhodoplanes sinuspersici]|nr:class I SAM-dependent methyltransferase [Pseudorhodoplanes sinuspersici]
MKLVLDDLGLPRPGQKVLHIAPERGLGPYVKKVAGDGYEAVDLVPKNFGWVTTRKFDLTTDAALLPSESYDLIIHSHVMEHIPCNITAVLYHLHRALKPTGYHICCIPIVSGSYETDFRAMDKNEATRRFGQFDHVRRFGVDDLHLTLGMIFKLPERYDLEARFGASVLDAHNIPKPARKGWSMHSIMALKKDDLLLVAAPLPKQYHRANWFKKLVENFRPRHLGTAIIQRIGGAG